MKDTDSIIAVIEGLLHANKTVAYFDDNKARSAVVWEEFDAMPKSRFRMGTFKPSAETWMHYDVVIGINPHDRDKSQDWMFVAEGIVIWISAHDD